jgi:hypothetical protein
MVVEQACTAMSCWWAGELGVCIWGAAEELYISGQPDEAIARGSQADINCVIKSARRRVFSSHCRGCSVSMCGAQ